MTKLIVIKNPTGTIITKLPVDGTTKLGQLNDVNAPSPSDGQSLAWDVATSKWIPKIVAGSGDLLAANNLSDLADTSTARANLGVAVGSDVSAYIKENFSATAAPLATDDSGSNYAIGSRWFDITNDKEYVCLDASVSTAVWLETTASASGGDMLSSNNLSDLASSTTARTNLGFTASITELNYTVGVTSAIQTQLNTKAASSHNHSAGDINSGIFANARIAQTNVTQHQSALNVTLSQVSDSGSLAAKNMVATADLDNNAVTLAKMADIATASFIGRNTAATGDPEILNATTARSILNVEDGATADQTEEEIQDFAWNVLMGTQTGIIVTYQDSTNDVDFVVGGLGTAQFASTNISQWTNDSGYITGLATLNDISNVTITANSSGEILKWNGTAWINNTLAEAGIATASHNHTLSDVTDSGTMAAQNANAVSITGGSISGITDVAVADGGTGASDAATARSNLGAGDVTGAVSSTDNAIARYDGTTGKVLQDSNILVGDDDELSGFLADFNDQIGISYSLVASDSGKVITATNAAAITITLPNDLPKGFNIGVIQGGVGAVTFSVAAGATLNNRQVHTQTAGQHSVVTLMVTSNSNGSNAVYNLGGDTA